MTDFKVVSVLGTELQAASFDWITGNLYMVYRNTRRIYVCNITEAIGAQKCTEILTNGVAGDVGGLALYPEDGYAKTLDLFRKLPSMFLLTIAQV